MCLCVYFICTAGCVWSLGCRFEYRLQVPGEHCAAQHRSKCPSLWSVKRKCAVSCGVLQGLWWPLIFHPALSLKECKTAVWGGPQSSEDTNSHSVGKWKNYTEACSWLPPGDSGLGDSAPHPPLAHLLRKEKQSLVTVTVTPTKPWKCPPHLHRWWEG